MTMYAPSDIMNLTVGVEGHGGCGLPHVRETGPDGLPVQPWALICGPCESFLRANDNRWSPTLDGIAETYDEKLTRENFETKGVRARDSLMAIAMARLAGLGASDIPPSLSKMLTGLPARVPGVMMCPAGHDNVPGSRYCRECGTAMGSPAAAGALTTGTAA